MNALIVVLLLIGLGVIVTAWLQRRGGPSSGLGLALLSMFLALPGYAQDPAVPPVAPPETPPVPSPNLWNAALDGGPSTLSTPEELTPYARLRVTLARPFGKADRFRAFVRGDADRTQDGGAFSIETLKTFASIEVGAGVLYRVGNSPVSVGGVGGVTWSRESAIKSPRDPRLWTGLALLCVERFAWWPNGGLACAGFGQRGPAGGLAGVVSITQPLKGGVALTVDFDLPVNKLPEVIKALPSAAQAAPLPTGPPTAEQIRGVAQKLPIAIKVGVLVRLKELAF